jgi:hypothetical protein
VVFGRCQLRIQTIVVAKIELDAGTMPKLGIGREHGAKAAANRTFDRWLTHHLGRLYDPVVQEPLPADMRRLLEKRLKSID